MLPPVTFSLGFVSVYVKFPNMSTYDLSPLQHQKGRKIPAEITIHIVWKSSPISSWNFSLVAFSTNFCPIEIKLYSNMLAMLNETFFMIIQHRRNGYCEMNTHFDVSADINHLWPRIRGCCYCQRLRMHTHTTERYSPLFLLLHQQQQRWHDEISSILKVNDTPFSPPLKVKGVEKGCVTKCPMGSVF